MGIIKRYCQIGILTCLCLFITNSFATPSDNFGQIIQIHTRFHTFVGKPSWLIVIRDVDHGQNIPYVFDITRGDNHFVLFTYSRNYLISASTMQMSTYKERYNTFGKYELKDFCGLQSNGHIIRGESLYITITGDLTPYHDTVECNVSQFKESNFSVADTE